MSLENPNKPLTPQAEFPLRGFFENMSDTERGIIEAEIFNEDIDINLDSTCKRVKDANLARQIMGMFRDYLDLKEKEVPVTVLHSRRDAVIKFIERSLGLSMEE